MDISSFRYSSSTISLYSDAVKVSFDDFHCIREREGMKQAQSRELKKSLFQSSITQQVAERMH